MGILTEQYMNLIRPKIDNVVASSLSGSIRSYWLYQIWKHAQNIVYSYEASLDAMEARRGEIGDEKNLEIDITPTSISIKNVTYLRHNDSQENPQGLMEIDVVERGLKYEPYLQPKPRPFMEDSLTDSMDVIEQTLQEELMSNGFDVEIEHTDYGDLLPF